MRKLVFLLVIFNIFFLPYSLRAQDSVEVVVISQRIGPFIDLATRNYLKIFSDYNDFLLAYFTRDSIEIYSLHILYQNDNGLNERKITVKKATLLTLGEKFDNYEKIKAGKYEQGSNPAQLKFLWIKKEKINKKTKSTQVNNYNDYSLISHTDVYHENLFLHYPRIGIGIGTAYTNFEFDGLKNFTDKIDSYYKGQEYFVAPIDPDYRMGLIYQAELFVEITRNISAALRVDLDLSSQTIEYKALSVMGTYNFIDLMDYFVPFAGLGYTRNTFNITIDYGKALIDPNGGMLESVTVDGGTEGLITRAGIKVLAGNSVSLGIAAEYYFLSAYKFEEMALPDLSSEIKPGNFSAGVFLNIIL